jgi:exonuclease III
MSKGTSASPPIPANPSSRTPASSQESSASRQPFQLNSHNLKHNYHWGPELLDLKPDDIFRIYFQNVNGLRLANNGLDILDFFCHMKSIDADIIGASEINVESHHPFVQRLFSKHRNQVWTHSRFSLSSSKISFNSMRKPGGTLVGVTGNTSGRTVKQYSDPMGCFSSITLLGKLGKHVTIISAYQVPRNSESCGKTTSHQQQVLQMKRDGIRDQNPRRQFCSSLDTYLSAKIYEKHQIILGGDFNEEVGLNMDGITAVIAKHNLVDVMRTKLGAADEPATYSRGSRRLDYIFMTDDIASLVRSCGAEPFNHRFFSDHRGLYVDLAVSGLFDRNLSPLASPQHRDIRSGNPSLIRKYISHLTQYFSEKDIPTRAEFLKHSVSRLEAESLDADISDAMLKAGKVCAQTSRLPLSPQLHEAQTKHRIFQQVLTQLLTHRDMTVQIQRRQAQLPASVILPSNLISAKAALRSARRHLRELSRIAYQLKEQHQSNKADALARSDDTSSQKVLTRLQRAATTKEMFRRLPSLKAAPTGGLSLIKIPFQGPLQPENPRPGLTVTEPSEIEHHLLQRNRQHFSQAKATPFATDPLKQEFNWQGTGAATERILNNEFHIMDDTNVGSIYDITSTSTRILQSCVRRLNEIPPGLSVHEMKKAYRIWNENTSTSPSGRHLGHYHALLKSDGLKKDSVEAVVMEASRDSIWSIHHTLFEYGIRNAHCFSRWKNIVNAMIEKEPGNPWIHRLRVIHLYENDYNMLLGTQYRKAVHAAEDAQALNDGNFGARTARSSLDPVGIEILQYEYSRLLRLDHLKFSNDATACYDRIVVNLASIVSRSFGLHSNITTVQGDMLQEAVYRIKTKMGISTGFYQHSDDSPVFGTGQGSKSSPPIWNFNSSVFFDTFDRFAYGATYYPVSGKPLTIGMTGFVDDNNCNSCEDAIHHEPSSTGILSRMRHDAQLWHDILWTSGGALELSKCQYHLMQWNFTMAGAPILETGTDPENHIELTGPTGDTLVITQLGCGTSYKTLGALVEPLQHQQTQYRSLLKNARLHTKLLATSSCKHNHAWVYYFSVFLRSVGYALPICHLTQSQLHTIQKPMTPILLAKMGLCRNTCRKLCFMSSYYGGLDLRDLYVAQGCGQIEFIIRHLRSPGMTGSLLSIVLGWSQFNAGVSYCIMTHPSTDLPHLEGNWLVSVRLFLKSIHGSLELYDPQIQPPQRDGDVYLMDLALSANLTKYEIRGINLCRLFFNALTLSDISNASGTRLSPGILDGSILLSLQSTPKGPKVKQPPPSDRAWTAWRKLLRHISDLRGNINYPQQLGNWTVSGPNLRRQWPFLYSPSHDSLYRSFHTSYEVSRPVRPRIYDFSPHSTSLSIPADSVPVECEERSDGWFVRSSLAHSEETITFDNSWTEYLFTTAPWERMLLQRTDFKLQSPHDVYDLLSHSTSSILVSDGAADHLQGSAGWVIAIGSVRVAQGQCPVPGFDPRSYRAEGYGMLCGLLFIQHLCTYCGHLNLIPLHTMYCDNLGLVSKTNKLLSFRLAPTQAALHSEYDVLVTIHDLLKSLPHLPIINHVKGHQDAKVAYQDLPLPAQLNCDADVLATAELRQFPTTCTHVPLLPSAKVQLSLGGVTVTRKLSATIRRQHGLGLMKFYMNDRFLWSNSTIESVNWDAFSRAFRARQKFRIFTFKLCFWHLPTGKIIHRRSPQYDPKCPACGHASECNDHLFQCPATSRRRWQSSFLSSTRQRAEACNTDPKLVHILLAGFRAYFDATLPPASEFLEYPRAFRKLVKAQSAVGWGHLLRGRIVSSWSLLQQDYMHRVFPDTKFDPDAWHRKLLHPLFIECHNLWTLRNGERHGTEQQTKRTKRLEQLERNLIEIYKYEPEVLASDRDLFDTPIADLLTLPPGEIEKWIFSRRPIILHSRRAARRHSTSNVRLLPSYFHPLKRHARRQNRRQLPPRTRSRSRPPTISPTDSLMPSHFTRLPRRPIQRRPRYPNPTSSPRPLVQGPFEFMYDYYPP